MHSKGLFLFIACFFLGSVKIFSQQFPFVYYTPKDGLVNSRIRSIKQDSKGRMYFITHSGLSVYDGAKFTNYRRLDGLGNELVNDLVEITPDSFLIATNTSAMNTLVRGKIGIYKTTDNFCPVINRFLKSKDGEWYVCADDGLYILKDKKFTLLPFKDREGIEVGHNLDRIIEWNNLFLIIPWSETQNEKLILYDKQTRIVTDIFTDYRVYSVDVNTKGELLASTSEGIKLIDRIFLQKGKLNLLPLTTEYIHLDAWKNTHISFDSAGNTWLNSFNRIITISPQKQAQVISAEQGLKASNLVDIFVDREGIIWMASDGNGVIKMTSTRLQLINNFFPGKPLAISAIHQQGDTTWLSNYEDQSIYRINKKRIHTFRLGKKIKVSNIYSANQGLYLADGKDVYCINNKDQATSYRNPEAVFISNASSHLGNGIVDRNGAIIQNIWKNDSTLLSVMYEKKRVMEYKISYAVDQLAIDKKNRLWAASRDNHILVFSLHPEKPSQYLRLLKDFSKELPEMGARSLAVDTNGNAWVGTRYNGLYFLQFQDMQFHSATQFTTHQGLTDNFIYWMYCDDNNNTWAGTQSGLDKISLKNNQYVIENITKSKDIFQTIFKIVEVEDNMIWVLTSDGNIIKISPDPSSILPSSPPLLLTSIVVNDKEYLDSANSFAHHQNNFLVSVAAPSFIDEKSILYSYLLKGSGKNNWSEPSNNSTFNFINLAPGEYELNLKAEFPAAMYPPKTLNYTFTIRSPYWETWWFRLLVAGIVIGLIYYFVRNYYRRMLEKKHMEFEKQQALEKERTRIATDMHDDLGAGLSKIRFLSETVQLNIREEAHQPTLQNIASSSVELVDKFNEIIWAMNEKNNSLEDLLYYIRNYTAKYCAENNLAYKISIPEDFPSLMISGEMRRHIFLTVKEALHNVVKHAQAKNVMLRIQLDSVITIIIQDDGKGFEITALKNKGNGLRNMEQRIKNVKGKLIIENKIGTLLKISVPLPEE